MKVPDTPGETILFPVIQTCEGGASTEWIQPTVEGEEEPEHPAPAITLTEAEGDGHGGADEEDRRATDGAEDGTAHRGRRGSSDDDDSVPTRSAIAGLDRRPGRASASAAPPSPAAGRRA